MPNIFAIMWANSSSESREIVKQQETYENDIRPRDNPLALWLAIRATHMIEAVGSGVIDRIRAKRQYKILYQRKEETLSSFKMRTDEAIRTLEAYEAAVPEPEEQAAELINHLDNTRYAQFDRLDESINVT